jgi:hypothetical protein
MRFVHVGGPEPCMRSCATKSRRSGGLKSQTADAAERLSPRLSAALLLRIYLKLHSTFSIRLQELLLQLTSSRLAIEVATVLCSWLSIPILFDALSLRLPLEVLVGELGVPRDTAFANEWRKCSISEVKRLLTTQEPCHASYIYYFQPVSNLI